MEILGIIGLLVVGCFVLACGGWLLRGLTWLGGGLFKFVGRGCGYLLFVVLFIMVILSLFAG